MAQIDHVVVLMLENRSFDSMLGRLYPDREDFDGLTGNETNRYNGRDIGVWASSGTSKPALTIPKPGPHERFDDMTDQIFESHPPAGPATMGGFVSNYMRDGDDKDPKTVMCGFEGAPVSVISQLAREFGVSDRWHASAPNQTWPNRFFAHTGTAGGYVNNEPGHVPFRMETIFKRLEPERTWRIYYHDVPHAMTLYQIWGQGDRLYDFEPTFLEDARTGNLPNYSFIEPRYFTWTLQGHPNDQHPSHNIKYGESLIARCYRALRNGPGWKKTLFIVTYDEHGGMYDHVPPPAAVSPDDFAPDDFTFNRYGVRVPAVIVSPWIPRGSIIRPPRGSQYPFDHTTILSTLRELFGLGAPLTNRDAVAPTLLHALSLDEPSNDGPSEIGTPLVSPLRSELVQAEAGEPNDLQVSLAQAGDRMPSGPANLREHAQFMAETRTVRPAPSTVEEARERARGGFMRFLRGAGPGADD